MRWILNRFKGRLILKSGAVIRFHCSDITIRRSGEGDLTSIKVMHSPAFPDYIRLDDISAVFFSRRLLRRYF